MPDWLYVARAGRASIMRHRVIARLAAVELSAAASPGPSALSYKTKRLLKIKVDQSRAVRIGQLMLGLDNIVAILYVPYCLEIDVYMIYAIFV